jgi:hypothetical protein
MPRAAGAVLLLALAGVPWGTRAAAQPLEPPSVRISVSAPIFEAGETITASVEARNPTGNPAADLYVGIYLPGGTSALFFASRTRLLGPLLIDLPAIFPRFAEAPPGFTLNEPAFFRFSFAGTGVAPGAYSFVAALVRAGALADNDLRESELLSVSVASFVFVPTAATPAYTPYRPPMAQVVAVGPVLVTSNPGVSPAALYEAGGALSVMLRHRPDAADRLRAAGALTAVFNHASGVCELPYYADLPASACALTSGGLGGVAPRPVTACNDAALLRLPFDTFGRGTRADGENTCVHELAHTIMNVGLSHDERVRIADRYATARAEGIWAGHFAMLSPDEFFAEMSQIYFCANPAIAAFFHPQAVNCADALRQYDPATHALLEAIYGGPADLR